MRVQSIYTLIGLYRVHSFTKTKIFQYSSGDAFGCVGRCDRFIHPSSQWMCQRDVSVCLCMAVPEQTALVLFVVFCVYIHRNNQSRTTNSTQHFLFRFFHFPLCCRSAVLCVRCVLMHRVTVVPNSLLAHSHRSSLCQRLSRRTTYVVDSHWVYVCECIEPLRFISYGKRS